MGKLEIGIVGCGKIAERHAEHISKIGTLKAVCDIKIERAEKFSEKYGSNKYDNIDEMLKNETAFDLVAVCTPNGLHSEHTIKCLKAGSNVICEKPMALTVRDCEMMINEAEKTNKRLFIVKQNRFNPPVEALKKILDENKMGKIFSIQINCFWNRCRDYYKESDWKGTKLLDGGVLFTQFSHFIDLLYWLSGDVKEVSSFGSNYNHKDDIEYEDTGVVIFELENGIIGTINYNINSYKNNMEGSITVFGEKGTVKIGGKYLNILEYQNIEGYKIQNLPESKNGNNYGFYEGSMSNHDKVYENINDVLLNGAAIKTNATEGLKTVQIINRIYKNMRITS
jgi:UDP-N-acetyl-2-amino-2-deoxyglucuronate dehydrogenase